MFVNTRSFSKNLHLRSNSSWNEFHDEWWSIQPCRSILPSDIYSCCFDENCLTNGKQNVEQLIALARLYRKKTNTFSFLFSFSFRSTKASWRGFMANRLMTSWGFSWISHSRFFTTGFETLWKQFVHIPKAFSPKQIVHCLNYFGIFLLWL